MNITPVEKSCTNKDNVLAKLEKNVVLEKYEY